MYRIELCEGKLQIVRRDSLSAEIVHKPPKEWRALLRKLEKEGYDPAIFVASRP
jgi:hypothetical protein